MEIKGTLEEDLVLLIQLLEQCDAVRLGGVLTEVDTCGEADKQDRINNSIPLFTLDDDDYHDIDINGVLWEPDKVLISLCDKTTPLEIEFLSKTYVGVFSKVGNRN